MKSIVDVTRDKGKEKEEVVIDIKEDCSETTPFISKQKTAQSFLSQFFLLFLPDKKRKIIEPTVKLSSLLQQVEKLLLMLKSSYRQENKHYQQQKTKSLVKVNFNRGLGAAVAGVSAGTTVTSWTMFGIRQAKINSSWIDEGNSFKSLIRQAYFDWRNVNIPGENVTCLKKYDVLSCAKQYENLIHYCEERIKQYCQAYDDYDDWNGSDADFDSLQIILVCIAILATIVTGVLIYFALSNRSYLYNKFVAPTQPYFGETNWKDPLNKEEEEDFNEEEIEELLSILKILSGIKAPDSFDEFISYVENIANQLRQHEKECGFMFYELANRGINKGEIYEFYDKILGTNILQMIIDHVAVSVFDKPDENLRISGP